MQDVTELVSGTAGTQICDGKVLAVCSSHSRWDLWSLTLIPKTREIQGLGIFVCFVFNPSTVVTAVSLL